MGLQEDERVRIYNAQLGGGSPQNQVEGGEGGTDVNTDYYKMLKDESYKAMLDSEIQASVSKENALKYTNNSLMAGGYGNQGVSESVRAGINNTFQNALTGAQAQNSANQVDIALQEQEANKAKATDSFEGLTTLMSNAGDVDQLNNILKNYDIEVENGVLKGAGLDELDTNSQRQLQSIYQLYSSQLGSSFKTTDDKGNEKPSFSKVDDFKSLKTENGTEVLADKGGVKNEINYILSNNDFLATLTNNMVVCLQNGKNSDSKLYLQFYNGKWYQVDATAYWNTSNRQLVKGK